MYPPSPPSRTCITLWYDSNEPIVDIACAFGFRTARPPNAGRLGSVVSKFVSRNGCQKLIVAAAGSRAPLLMPPASLFRWAT